MCKEVLNNVSEAVRTRKKSAKKRSLQVVNEHFIRFAPPFGAVLKHVQSKDCELVFNNVLTTQVVIQSFPKTL